MESGGGMKKIILSLFPPFGGSPLHHFCRFARKKMRGVEKNRNGERRKKGKRGING